MPWWVLKWNFNHCIEQKEHTHLQWMNIAMESLVNYLGNKFLERIFNIWCLSFLFFQSTFLFYNVNCLLMTRTTSIYSKLLYVYLLWRIKIQLSQLYTWNWFLFTCSFMSGVFIFRTIQVFHHIIYLSNIFKKKSLWWNTYLQETMKNIDLRIHGGTWCCSMSILTAKLEEAVEQGEIVYMLVYTLRYKETEVTG